MDVSQAGALVPCPSDDSDSDSESSIYSSDDESVGWTSDTDAGRTWIFSDSHGSNDRVLICIKPIRLFLNGDLINRIKEETNRYRRAKDPTFAETSKKELSKLTGLCIQMGFVKLPSLRDYWNTRAAF